MRMVDASVDALGAANTLCDDSGNAQVRVILKIVAYTTVIDVPQHIHFDVHHPCAHVQHP